MSSQTRQNQTPATGAEVSRDSRMRFWDLRFRDHGLERLYQQSYFGQNIKGTRIGITLGLIVLLVFAVVEPIVLQTSELVNQVRLFFVLPVILFGLVVSFFWSKHFYLFLAAACTCVMFSQIALLIKLGDATATNTAMAYLQHMIFIAVLLRQPFRILFFPAVVLTVLMTFALRHYTSASLVTLNYEVAVQSIAAICLALTYVREQEQRRLFATAVKVEELREETERQQLGQISWLRNLSRYLEHELRDHVFIAQSNLEHLQRSIGEEQAPIARRALRSVEKLSDICDSVGEASTLESALQLDRMYPLNFSRMVSERVLERVREFGEVNPLELDVDPNLWVAGSETRLLQVFDHLLDNALDYSSEDAFVRIEVKSIARSVYFTVHNKGEALPEDRDVFEIFDTTRPNTNLGLGLYVSRKIVEHHLGSIEARTELGQTIVLVTLPQVEVPATGRKSSASRFDNVLNINERLRRAQGTGEPPPAD